MENIKWLSDYLKEFIKDPEKFGYDAMTDLIKDFADQASEKELEAIGKLIAHNKWE